MLAAITRDYTESVHYPIDSIVLKPFALNKNILPKAVDEYIAYANAWKKSADCSRFVYEYHFWVHQYRDPGAMTLAKIIYDDIRGYKKNGFDGIIQDGSQRSFFPNGFAFYVYSQTLYDTTLGFEEIKEDYFRHAYGKDWKEVVAYLEKISESFDQKFLEQKLSANIETGAFYNPEHAKKLREIPAISEEFMKQHYIANLPYRVQTVSYRLLLKHAEYCKGLAQALALKAYGADEDALAAYDRFANDFGKSEAEIERYYDHFTSVRAFCDKIFKRRK